METGLMFKALGEPTRFRLFQMLLKRKRCVRSLARETGLSEAAVSQHMKVLREAGLVHAEQFGYHTHYVPEPDALTELGKTMEEMKRQALSPDTEPEGFCCACRKKEESK